jgi:hypothetical protein
MCIFRFINSSFCCPFKSKKCDNYCHLHINNRNIVYDIIFQAIGNNPIKSSYDIYLIFKYIYNNPDIYVKKLIFIKVLSCIFIKIHKLKLLFPYLNNNSNLFSDIYNINLNTYILEKYYLNNINIIQKFIIKKLVKPHLYNSNLIIHNENDPFTLELIHEIPYNERFIYNHYNNIYCFKPLELQLFLSNNNWNPFNKKEFNVNIYRKLSLFIKFFHLNPDISNNYKWTSISQAFTDASLALDKMGFYNNKNWFLSLNQKKIKNIVKLFHIISSSISTHNNFFPILSYNIMDNTNDIYFNFAKDIISLFNEGNNYFNLCCNFMKSISIYNNDFYNSLPQWLIDIETPIIIINPNINENIIRRRINNLNSNLVYLINIIEN